MISIKTSYKLFFVFTLAITSVACGGGASSNTPKALTSSLWGLIQKGAYQKAAHFYFTNSDHDLDTKDLNDGIAFLREILRGETEQKGGGIADFSILEEEINGNVAKVYVSITYKDGSVVQHTSVLNNTGGRWKFEFDF